MALALAGCGLLPGAAGGAAVNVRNDTTLVITVRINAKVVAQVEPGSTFQLPGGDLGPTPWAVELLRPNGNIVAGNVISTEQAACGTAAACDPATTRAHMTCGDAVLWLGQQEPPVPPEAPGTGIPCEP